MRGETHPALLERAAELRAIDGALAAARSGAGSAVLIEGPAGIGKTSLLAYARAAAAAAGMTVLSARAAEFESGYAWGVVRQLFRPEALATVLGADAGADVGADADVLAAAALDSLYWLTADGARLTPMLIAVDDLHWADQPSLRFTLRLARRVDGLAVALITTVREPRPGTAQEKALLADLSAETSVTVVRPAALGVAASAGLVSEAVGGTPSAGFLQACLELTGGNPLLLRELAAGLAAEDVRGRDEDVPYLRRLTLGPVSRSVLLQLGRMPAPALAAARAIALLGTAATTTRAGQLADLDTDATAEAIALLMAERLILGNQALEFVHPLIRSAVYQDLAAPVRERWHGRAARILDAEGAPGEDVCAHLLASGPAGDPWVVGRLRAAAVEARSRGAPDVAILCLQRALAEPPPAADRADVLFELGSLQILQADAAAADHLAEALTVAADPGRRAQIVRLLGEALGLRGQFAAAVELLVQAVEEAGDSDRESLQATLFTLAQMDPGTRMAVRPMLEQFLQRAARGESLDPRMHGCVALELMAAGQDLDGAVRSARAALQRPPAAVYADAGRSQMISVLLYSDRLEEASAAVRAWLSVALEQGAGPAAAITQGFASMIALYGGDVSPAITYGMQALAGTTSIWIASIYLPYVIHGLIERGDLDQARAMLTERGLMAELWPFWPHNLVRHARGCLHAAAGDHAAAAADLLTAGEQAGYWGFVNPVIMPWRSDVAPSLTVLGRRREAARLCAEELDLARKWGAARAVGVALRAAGVVQGGSAGIDLMTEAVAVLRESPARLELARALVDLGAAQRRAGARVAARDLLREGLDLAHRQGGLRLADRARRELVIAGGKPRRDAIRGRDALTPSELAVAELAVAGQTNRQIAQALFVTQRTVENHLTNAYAKLRISSRAELEAALTGD